MSRTQIVAFSILVIALPSFALAQNGVRQPAPRKPGTTPQEASLMKRAADKTERVILGQINTFERELELAGARLEKQLAAAEQLRQRGLKDENTRILQQAEQLERKALQDYEHSINNFNRRSVQLERHTKSRAGASNKSTQKRNVRPRTQTQPTRRQARSRNYYRRSWNNNRR